MTLSLAIDAIVSSLRDGGTLHACGNGGSDAHAGHLVAELVGRFAYDRPPLRAVHLSSGGPVGSCIANDYGWDEVFARQVRALCGVPKVPDPYYPGWDDSPDVLVVFTTSGRSKNIWRALEAAHELGGTTVAFTGPAGIGWDGDVPRAVCEVRSSAMSTPAIQEEHQRWVHEIARAVEEALCPK